MKIIDARGRSCPEPVMMVQKQFKANDELEVLVDNVCAVQNITRFAENKGASISVSGEGDEYTLIIKK